MKFFAMLAVIIPLVMSAPAQSQLFQVTDGKLSRSVSNDGNYTVIGPIANNEVTRSSLSAGNLFFSFKMLGLQPAMDYLQLKHSLDAHVVVYAGLLALVTIPCGITQEKWFGIGDKLLDKFKTDSLFTFRTWVNTAQTTYSSLTFIVRDVYESEVTRTSITISP